jgi:hypothetical protein
MKLNRIGEMNNYKLSESVYYLYNPLDQCRIGFSGTLDECVDWIKRNKIPCDIRSVDARIEFDPYDDPLM